MSKLFVASIFVITYCFMACTNPTTSKKEELKNLKEGSFGFDLQFLNRFDSVIVLKSDDGKAQVIVFPKYQGKVFTSTAEGLDGRSFGWINYKAFTAPPDSHMNAYGGENRLWLGPEGGPFSLFFPKDSPMIFGNWKTPAPIDTEAWSVFYKDRISVRMKKDMSLENYKGTKLKISVHREIRLMEKHDIEELVKVPLNDSVHSVGFVTNNAIENRDDFEWNQNTGMPCIWILDMFTPSAESTVVIPYIENETTPVITTNYFGEIPSERIKMRNGVLFFKADGKMRGKLGIHPGGAKNLAGSFDANANILTITFFDINTKGKYLNQEWNTQKPPFSGDAINSYNDGPLTDGKQIGPFYEIESVSPAAFLKPGESLMHSHIVLHFVGSKPGLDLLARKVFGISIDEIRNAFTIK